MGNPWFRVCGSAVWTPRFFSSVPQGWVSPLHMNFCVCLGEKKVVWQLSGLLGKCWGIRFGRERTSGVTMHGPFIKDAVTLQVLHGSVAFDSSTTKVLHRHDRDFLFEGKKQQTKTKKTECWMHPGAKLCCQLPPTICARVKRYELK